MSKYKFRNFPCIQTQRFSQSSVVSYSYSRIVTISFLLFPGEILSSKMSDRDDIEALWAKVIASQQPAHNSTDCIMCRRKMKGKRSKSLSPEPSSSREAKMARLSGPDEENGAGPIGLLEFSDDVLLNILQYLSPQDLFSLSLCCRRLNGVCRDRTLWRIVDFRTKPIRSRDLKRYTKYFQSYTEKLAIKGNFEDDSGASRFEELGKDVVCAITNTCPNLKAFHIENYAIKGDALKIVDLPQTLQTLSLKGTDVSNVVPVARSYFFKIDTHMPNLTTLILSECSWLSAHSLLVISKIPKLKELRMNSCENLGECVAYASLATRFGFKSLEILDLRLTAFGDSEIRCFSSTKTLTHMYLEYSPEFKERDELLLLAEHARRRAYEDDHVIQYIADEHVIVWSDPSCCRITDRSICALGSYVCDRRVLDNSIRDVILVEPDIRVLNNPLLKTLVVRNYPQVTNQSLVHLAANATSLEYLDVTGTGVTADAVATFKAERPEVTLISSFG